MIIETMSNKFQIQIFLYDWGFSRQSHDRKWQCVSCSPPRTPHTPKNLHQT